MTNSLPHRHILCEGCMSLNRNCVLQLAFQSLLLRQNYLEESLAEKHHIHDRWCILDDQVVHAVALYDVLSISANIEKLKQLCVELQLIDRSLHVAEQLALFYSKLTINRKPTHCGNT